MRNPVSKATWQVFPSFSKINLFLAIVLILTSRDCEAFNLEILDPDGVA